MQQPQLGRKIAKLRKAKGLTQEEVVQKCNLSVRTLQRIEAGEVTPRSYTIKLIFTELGHDAYEAKPTLIYWLHKTGTTISGVVMQSGGYVKELFNLKTNMMKKLTILSIFFLTICTVVLSACFSARTVIHNQNTLVGTWQILNSKGVRDSMYNGQPGLIRYKMVTDNKFINLDVLYNQNLMYAGMAGTYSIYDNVYTETITTVGNNYGAYLGIRNTFKYKVVDSVLYVNGINNPYNEVWKRVK